MGFAKSRPVRYVAVVVALLLSACGSTAAPSQGKPAGKRVASVKVATETKAVTELPVYVAVDKGFFKKAGVEVDLVQFGNAAPAIEALHAGDVQFLAAGTINFLRYIEKGMKLIAVAGYVDRAADELTLSDSVLKPLGIKATDPISKRLSALRGQTLGIEAVGGIVDGLTRYVVREAGLKVGTSGSDVRLVSFQGPAPMVAAMQHGQIDGFLSAIPWPAQTQAAGFGTVLVSGLKGDVAGWNNITQNEIAVTTQYAAAHPGQVRAVAKAIAEADDYVRQNPSGALAVAKKYFPSIKPEVLSVSVQEVTHAIPAGGRMSATSWQRAQQLWLASGLLKKPVNLKKDHIWTNQYLPSKGGA